MTWSRGADKEPAWSVCAEIVIHQPAEQVRTDEGIQENNWWRRKGWGGGGDFKMGLLLFVGEQPWSVRTQRGLSFIASPDRLMDVMQV